MSRNLGSTSCYFCHGTVVHDEQPRLITLADCGAYFDEYRGMFVAAARCEDCQARYLAWVTEPRSWARTALTLPHQHVDLSFLSSFNDEPGPQDMPEYRIKRVPVREPWPTCSVCGGPQRWRQWDSDRYECMDYHCPTRTRAEVP